jgi:general secretion pathway protein L
MQQKRERTMLIEILNETTRLMPDNTWVTHFRLYGDQLTLAGNSAAASALIEALESSPKLSQVSFASPITFDPKQGVERFNLSAAVVANGGER